MNIFLTFFIPFPIENNVLSDYEYNYSKIRIHYIKTWLIFDCLFGIPINTIFNFIEYKEEDKVLRNRQYLSLLRILKVFIAFKNILIEKRHKKNEHSYIDDYIGSNGKRLFQFFIFLFTLTHISSCIWAFIGQLEHPNWIYKYNLLDKANIEIYFASMYYNFATIFSIGYGDICATNFFFIYVSII